MIYPDLTGRSHWFLFSSPRATKVSRAAQWVGLSRRRVDVVDVVELMADTYQEVSSDLRTRKVPGKPWGTQLVELAKLGSVLEPVFLWLGP